MTGSMWMGIAIFALVAIGAFIVFVKSADDEEKSAEDSLEETLAGLRDMGTWEGPKSAHRETFDEEEKSFFERFYSQGNRVTVWAQKRVSGEREKIKERALQEYKRDKEKDTKKTV